MVNKTKIFSDLSKIAVDAMSTFSGVKKELETIVNLLVNKIINKMNLVRRDEFEALKKTVQQHISDSNKKKTSKKSTKTKKSLKTLKKSKK